MDLHEITGFSNWIYVFHSWWWTMVPLPWSPTVSRGWAWDSVRRRYSTRSNTHHFWMSSSFDECISMIAPSMQYSSRLCLSSFAIIRLPLSTFWRSNFFCPHFPHCLTLQFVSHSIPCLSIIVQYIYNTSTCSVLPLLSNYNLTKITIASSFPTVSKWQQVTCMTATGAQLLTRSTTSRADPRFAVYSQPPSCSAATTNLLNRWVIRCDLICSDPVRCCNFGGGSHGIGCFPYRLRMVCLQCLVEYISHFAEE